MLQPQVKISQTLIHVIPQKQIFMPYWLSCAWQWLTASRLPWDWCTRTSFWGFQPSPFQITQFSITYTANLVNKTIFPSLSWALPCASFCSSSCPVLHLALPLNPSDGDFRLVEGTSFCHQKYINRIPTKYKRLCWPIGMSGQSRQCPGSHQAHILGGSELCSSDFQPFNLMAHIN